MIHVLESEGQPPNLVKSVTSFNAHIMPNSSQCGNPRRRSNIFSCHDSPVFDDYAAFPCYKCLAWKQLRTNPESICPNRVAAHNPFLTPVTKLYT